jgi:hypothetical protein
MLRLTSNFGSIGDIVVVVSVAFTCGETLKLFSMTSSNSQAHLSDLLAFCFKKIN